MYTVTIGLPVYNKALFLADAIQSVLNQTLTDWELLIIDDGSTDNSLAIAHSFTDSRIRVLADGINRGLPARLNQLAHLAKGRYLARMDADDLMTPDRLQHQVDFMEATPTVDVVAALAYVIDTQNQVYGLRGTTRLPTTRSQAAAGVSLIHPTILARCHWFRHHPYRTDCRRAEDFDLWLRTVESTTFYVIDKPLLFYRESGPAQLKNYRDTATDVRDTLRRFRGYGLTTGRFWQLMFVSYSKEMVYKLAARAGQSNLLLRRRNHSLSSTEYEQAQALLLRTSQPRMTPSLTN